MITKQDLDEAILECQGKRNPDANTCMKLAAFYTIKNQMFPTNDEKDPEMPIVEGNFSYSHGNEIVFDGESDFSRSIHGRDQLEVFPIIDELMDTLKVINPRLYSGVMRRLNQ